MTPTQSCLNLIYYNGMVSDSEFFVPAMTKDSWQLTSPIGYSYQSLDQLLLSSLQCDEAQLGLKLDNIPVEVSKQHEERQFARAADLISLCVLLFQYRPRDVLKIIFLSSCRNLCVLMHVQRMK